MTYKNVYNDWIKHPLIDKKDKDLLLLMDEKGIEDSFYKDIDFGTGGLRGLMGLGTNRINVYTIRRATQGFANYLINHADVSKGIAISYDNRYDSQKFAFETAEVLAANNIPSYVFENLRPTPMLSYAVRHFNCAGGIMITASHNPKEYNGYKVYNASGAQLNALESDLVIDYVNKVTDPFSVVKKSSELIKTIDVSFDEIYLKEVENIIINEPIRKTKIVYSPLHGTGGTVIPKLLKKHGFNVFPLESQMTVDPAFSNTLSSNPEEDKAYIESIKYANEIDADLILVTDPDADRLGVAVKHQGKYQLLTGNQTASIMLEYIIKQKNPKQGFVFTTVVTSDLIKTIALKNNHLVGETLTGFKFIGEQALRIENKADYIFGCEESYGSLVKDFVRDKDAVQAVFMLSEMADFYASQKLTLVDALNNVYKTYGYFSEYTENISLKGVEGARKIQEIMTYFRENHLEGSISVEDYSQEVTKPNGVILPKSNVIKFYFDTIWVVLRPSGTEPKLKIYFSASDLNSVTLAEEKIEVMKNKILSIIEKMGE